MTFKGATYSSILDLELLIITREAILRALKIEHKALSLTRDILALQENQVKINVYEKCIESLHELEQDLISKIDALNEEANDVQGKIFIAKFIKGHENEEIMKEVHITKSTLYYYYDKIAKQLENTTYGKQVKEALSE